LTHSQVSAQTGTRDFTAPGYGAVQSGTTLTITGSLASSSGSGLALHSSPTLYLSGDVRFNNLYVSGDLDLTSAGDSLEANISPYLLRPTVSGNFQM
jgi:hypothetical protein